MYSLFNYFLTFCRRVIYYYVMRHWIDKITLLSFLLLLTTASMFPNHIKYFYGEVFATLAVFLGILLLSNGKFILGSLFIGLGTASTPATLIGTLLLFAVFSFTQKKLRYLLFSLFPILLILLENRIRRGNFFAFGYADNRGFVTILPYSGKEGFSYPFFFGVLSILFSFGKGLIFFSPASILYFSLDKKKFSPEIQTTLKLSFYYILGLILVYAKWWSWYGGWFWGPRFFLFTSIFSSLLITLFLFQKNNFPNRLLALFLVTLSFWVGFSGLVFDQNFLDHTCTAGNYANEFLCWYLPEFSVLWHPLIIAKGLTPKEIYIRNFFIFTYLIITVPFWINLFTDWIKFVLAWYKKKGTPGFKELAKNLKSLI